MTVMAHVCTDTCQGLRALVFERLHCYTTGLAWLSAVLILRLHTVIWSARLAYGTPLGTSSCQI